MRTALNRENIGSTIFDALASCVQILGDEGALPTSDGVYSEPWRQALLNHSLDGAAVASQTVYLAHA